MNRTERKPTAELHNAQLAEEEQEEDLDWLFPKINTICFCVCVVVMGVLATVLPNPTFSEVEKRELAAKPALSAQAVFSSQYMKDFSAWFADTFPGREGFITVANWLEDSRGIRPDEVKLYSGTAKPATEPESQPEQPTQPPQTPEQEAPAEPEQPAAPKEQEDDAVGYLMDNGVFVVGDRAVNLFGGSNAMGEYYANTLNSYLDELPAGVQVYNLVAPCSAEFYLPARYRASSADQQQNISHIYSCLDERIKAVDAYSELAAHTDEYIYFRTDHHWTGLGAYYAYTAFCRQAGLEPLPLEQMEARTREGFLGTFYSQTGDPVLQQNPDSLTYYIPPTEYKAWLRMKDQPNDFVPLESIWGEFASLTNSYSIFLCGDYPLEKIVTEHQNGRKIVVVKESYGNAFVPFLLSHFEEIYVVDQRYFQTSLLELIEQNGVTDLLFLNNAFAANTSYHIGRIDGLKHQVWTPPQPAEETDDETAEP